MENLLSHKHHEYVIAGVLYYHCCLCPCLCHIIAMCNVQKDNGRSTTKFLYTWSIKHEQQVTTKINKKIWLWKNNIQVIGGKKNVKCADKSFPALFSVLAWARTYAERTSRARDVTGSESRHIGVDSDSDFTVTESIHGGNGIGNLL